LKINEGFFGELIAVIFIASLFDNMPIASWNIENGYSTLGDSGV